MDTDQSASIVRMTGSELARSASVDESFVEELTSLSILEPDERGRVPTDVYRVRFAALVAQAGIGLGALAQAKDAGVSAFGNLEVLFPDPVRATERTYEELAADVDVEPQSLARVRLAGRLGRSATRGHSPVR